MPWICVRQCSVGAEPSCRSLQLFACVTNFIIISNARGAGRMSSQFACVPLPRLLHDVVHLPDIDETEPPGFHDALVWSVKMGWGLRDFPADDPAGKFRAEKGAVARSAAFQLGESLTGYLSIPNLVPEKYSTVPRFWLAVASPEPQLGRHQGSPLGTVQYRTLLYHNVVPGDLLTVQRLMNSTYSTVIMLTVCSDHTSNTLPAFARNWCHDDDGPDICLTLHR